MKKERNQQTPDDKTLVLVQCEGVLYIGLTQRANLRTNTTQIRLTHAGNLMRIVDGSRIMTGISGIGMNLGPMASVFLKVGMITIIDDENVGEEACSKYINDYEAFCGKSHSDAGGKIVLPSPQGVLSFDQR